VTREFHILNLGAGVQSTALYLMFLRGDLKPQIDYAIFADTQDEPKAVYKHLEWLQSLNGPPILIRSKGRLSEHLMKGQNSTGQRFASIPAYTLRPDGTEGKVRRQCSAEYKIEVIQRTIRREICGAEPGRSPKGVSVHQYIGISLDESGRARRISSVPRPRWLRKIHFPLIENFMTLANCLTYLADKVPHETPRSACVFCPFHSDYEWDRQKREDPEILGRIRGAGQVAAHSRQRGQQIAESRTLSTPLLCPAGPRATGHPARPAQSAIGDKF